MCNVISLRISEVTADDTGRLHFQPWRVLWALSWIQHNLIYRDCLLVHHCALSKHFKKIKENSKSLKKSCIQVLFCDKKFDQKICDSRNWEVFWQFECQAVGNLNAKLDEMGGYQKLFDIFVFRIIQVTPINHNFNMYILHNIR